MLMTNSNTGRQKKESTQRAALVTPKFLKVMVGAVLSASLLSSQMLNAQSENESPEQTSSFSPEQNALMGVYQNCISLIMSDIELKAAGKREQLSVGCGSERDAWVSTMPEMVRPLILENIDRRIDAVLMTLEQIENVVVEAAEDAQEILDELESGNSRGGDASTTE